VRDKRPGIQPRTKIKNLGTIHEGAAVSGPTFEMGKTTEVLKFIDQSRKAAKEEFLI